jgi:hypothetical protein
MPHNGNLCQINLGPPDYFGCGFEFINIMKMAKAAGPINFATNYASAAPDLYNEDGYPISTSAQNAGRQIWIPRAAKRSHNYKVRWVGNCSLTIGGTSIGAATDYEGTFTPNGSSYANGLAYGMDVFFGNINEGNPPTSLEIFHVDDETKLDNGQIFQDQFLDLVGNFGEIRDLLSRRGNSSLVALWEHEHNVDAISYAGCRCPSGYYKGATTNVGNAYDITISGGFTYSHGNGFVVRWNATASGACTLSVNGGDDLPIYGVDGLAVAVRPTATHYSAVVWDSFFNAFLIQTGAGFADYAGFNPGWPPSIFLELCDAVGAHPWFAPRHLTLEVAAGHATPMAQAVKTFIDTRASWMHPVVEAVANETWNPGFSQTVYAYGRSTALWPAGGSTNVADYISRAASLHGAAWDAVFNDQSRYDFPVGVQYTSATAEYCDTVLSGRHVSVSGGTPADEYITDWCPALYAEPGYTEQQEIDEAYVVAAISDEEDKQARVNTFVADSPARFGTGVNYLHLHWVPICADTGKGYRTYEGAFSFDFPTVDSAAVITGVSSAAQAVITLQSGALFPPVGSSVRVGSVVGTTQINTVAVTFSGGGSANINGTNGFAEDRRVRFVTFNGALPAAIVEDTDYYVVSAGNPFQISATEGGSAITFATAGSGDIFCRPQYEVIAVDRTLRTVTTDFDSSAAGSYVSGGTMSFSDSALFRFNLRYRSKAAPELENMIQKIFTQYTLNGGKAPSTFALNSIIEGFGSIVGSWEKMQTTYETPVPEFDGIVAFSTAPNTGVKPLKLRLIGG